MFGDIGGLGKMMKLLSDVKNKGPEVMAKLAATEYCGDAGGGVVKATVNGTLTLVDLKIDPAVLTDPEMDGEMLADLIKAAVSLAQQHAAQAKMDAMKELTGGMDLPPGMGF